MNTAVSGLRLAVGRKAAFAVAFSMCAASAFAQQPGCIELKTTAEIEQEYINAQGQKAKRLAPANKVTPGDEVVWTITAKNVCATPAENIVIANPVPEHMTYIAGSALGVGTTITYSLDTKEFKDAAALTVRDANGATRSARGDEYRAVKWAYNAPFAPGSTAFVRYRAIVK